MGGPEAKLTTFMTNLRLEFAILTFVLYMTRRKVYGELTMVAFKVSFRNDLLGVVLGEKIEVLFQHIQAFLAKYTKEVIVLELSHDYGANSTMQKVLPFLSYPQRMLGNAGSHRVVYRR